MKSKPLLSALVFCLYYLAIAADTNYSFKEQKEKGYIWNGKKFVFVNITEDLVDSFFFEGSKDAISYMLLQKIERDNKELAEKITNVQNSYVTCKVNQHVGPGEITAYVGNTLIYIDGNGYSFDSIADDQSIGLHLIKEEGTYQYITVLGSTNTIRKYKVRDIKQEKKELLDYYLFKSYLEGIQQDIMNGYIDISYCKDCSRCKGTSRMDCLDCNGTCEIENYKVSSPESIIKEVEKIVAQRMKYYEERFERQMRSKGQELYRPERITEPYSPTVPTARSGDALAVEKAKKELEEREERIREAVTNKIKNKKVPCPYCIDGKVLCSAHKYETVTYNKEYSAICDSRKNRDKNNQ